MKTASWFTFFGPGRVSISRGAPRRSSKGYRIYKALAPGPWFKTADEETYINLFYEQLAKLDAPEVVRTIHELSGDEEPVLLCFEKPDDNTWCHRALVSKWLHDELGLEVPELGHEETGYGLNHPLLPPSLKQRQQSNLLTRAK